MRVQFETKGHASVAWRPSPRHPYEDRYRLLTRDIPLVRDSSRGEVVALFDGIGSAPLGRGAAQSMADGLLRFYREPMKFPSTAAGLAQLLYEENLRIHDWGCVPGSNRPLGGCAGTVAWLQEGMLRLFHAGDCLGLLLRPGSKPWLLTTAHDEGGALTRYFGLGKSLCIEVEMIPVVDEDLVLLMSDGVTKVFEPLAAAEFFAEAVKCMGAPARAVQELVEQSWRKGASDDITVLALEVTDADL